MGNSLTTKTLSFKDKFIKILENNLNQSELRDRFLDIQNLNPNEDSILSSITKEDFQSSIKKFPDNVITLIRFLIDSIFGLTELKRILAEEEVSILNFLLKMLARILPFLYDEKYHDFCLKTLWEDNPNLSIDEISGPGKEEWSASIEKKGKKDKKPKMVVIRSDSLNLKEQEDLWYPYGIKILKSLNSLLFFPGYTISNEIQFRTLESKSPVKSIKDMNVEINENILWKHFNQLDYSENKYFILNRISVLQSLISLSSFPFYRYPSSPYSALNPYLAFITSPKNPFINEIVISFLNCLISFEENGVLPYSGFISKDQNYATYGLLIAQFLSLLICNLERENFNEKNANAHAQNNKNTIGNNNTFDKNFIEMQEIVNYYLNAHPFESNRGSVSVSFDSSYSFNDILSNHTFYIIAQIKNMDYLNEILKNLLRLISNPIDSKNTFFKDSMKQIKFSEELMILLFRLCQYNQLVFSSFNKNELAINYLTVILTIINDKFMFNYQSGLFMISSSLLLILSCNREFVSNFMTNLKCSIVLNNCPIISGNYFDFIITVIINGLLKNFEEDKKIQVNNFTSILFNISPFVKFINQTTCFKILELVVLFSNYEYLLENESFFNGLQKLLKIIDNIIVYEGDKNLNLIQEIYRNRDLFVKIAKMKVSEKMILFFLQSKNPTTFEEKNEEEQKTPTSFPFSKEEKEKFKDIVQKTKNSWDDVKRNINLNNIFSLITYIERKGEQIGELDLDRDKKIDKIMKDNSLVGIVGKNHPLTIDAITDFTTLNKILKEYVWYLICVKNVSLPILEISSCKMLSSQFQE